MEKMLNNTMWQRSDEEHFKVHKIFKVLLLIGWSELTPPTQYQKYLHNDIYVGS